MSYTDIRQQWAHLARKLSTPILTALSKDQLRFTMPVETNGTQRDRAGVTHLEAVGRLLVGLAPWLQNDESASDLALLVPTAMRVALDPSSNDLLNFDKGQQPLVDAAFLAQAILHAPDLLWHQLDTQTQGRLVDAMQRTRTIKPGANNWLLFSAMVEAFLAFVGETYDAMRVDYALRQFEQWYKGDGVYGDGAQFHWDYYNSLVIHPMLLDVVHEMSRHRDDWSSLIKPIEQRAERYAVILERLIAPDGSFPAIGRSLAYRCGAFFLLAQLAYCNQLPASIKPAQARSALDAVIRRTMLAENTFDNNGYLTIGLAGHQPGIGEGYISTGSLYLCSTAFLPLGLDATQPFWADESVAFTGLHIWGGGHVDAPDHALYG